ncbi:MAG: phosphoribosyl-ATP diphosphatase [Micavibrio sp.]|nr:phosphoribosyl-ATP diphosphatase [Micavibrio sp.]
MSEHILSKLYEILQQRKNENPEDSYVASLYKKGAKKINAKITEEADEFAVEVLALEQTPSNAEVRTDFTNECADLLFHMMVALSYHDVEPQKVFEVLEKRFGTSGHDEKAARSK